MFSQKIVDPESRHLFTMPWNGCIAPRGLLRHGLLQAWEHIILTGTYSW
ncbi:hypothetical protein CCP2SC5_1380007 [Azospirillaceae bacterium]